MMKLSRVGTLFFALLSVWLSGTPQAQDIGAQQAALKDIRETAADICYTIPQRGDQSDLHLSGEVDAKLAGVISRIADLGIKGAGELKNQHYQGVLREQLAATLKESADCKRDVFKILVDKMLPPSASTTGHQGISAADIEQRTEKKCSPAIVGAGSVEIKCQ